MNRDRGTIKWNAMMLPEHVKLLREWQAEDKIIAKPELDEWVLQEMSGQIQWAYEQQSALELTVWEVERLYKVQGKIARVDRQRSILQMWDGRQLSLDTVCGVLLLE